MDDLNNEVDYEEFSSLSGEKLCGVILDDAGPNKVKIIRVVKNNMGIGLKEAMELVDNSPSLICNNISLDRGKLIAEELADEGAFVRIVIKKE